MGERRAQSKALRFAPATNEEWHLWLEWTAEQPGPFALNGDAPYPPLTDEQIRDWGALLSRWREDGRAADVDDGLVRLSDVAPTEVRWLWEPRIPFGKLTVLEGDPENGKSTASLAVAAAVSGGEGLPSGAGDLRPATVLLLVPEDGLADTVVPKLKAYGANLKNVVTMGLQRDERGRVKTLAIPEDVERLEGVIARHDVGLVVIDPITAVLDETINTNSDASVRRALTPLAHIAETHGCAIVLVRHLNKTGEMKALYRGGGSIAFTGVARSVLVFDRHPDDRDLYVMARVKNNLAGVVPAQTFRIVKNETYGVVRAVWERELLMTADELLSGHDARKDAPARKEAEQFLIDVLEAGPMRVKEVEKLASEAGLTKTTVKRAKKSLGVKAKATYGDDNMPEFWTWQLPKEAP